MLPLDMRVIAGVGVLFIVLGLAFLVWARMERNAYDLSLANKRDIREFITHWPLRPEPEGLVVGGSIMLTIGVVLSVVGFYLIFKGQ